MWTLYWDDKITTVNTIQEVFENIDKLNIEYTKKNPIIIQIENTYGDIMCMGIGNCKEYSVVNFFPFEGEISKHIEGENSGNEVLSFYMGDYESEYYVNETIKYDTALKVLKTFLTDNLLDSSVKWVND